MSSKAGLEVKVIAKKKTIIENTEFPSAFVTPNKEHYLLQTHSEGLLLPVDDNKYPVGIDRPYFCGGGTAV